MAKTNEELLVNAATTIALRAAREWMDARGVKIPEGGWPDFADCLRANLKIRLPEALRDAREAMECGMTQVAETTFAASIAIAGIDAAKEVAVPAGL